jgi:hypothetical protein
MTEKQSTAPELMPNAEIIKRFLDSEEAGDILVMMCFQLSPFAHVFQKCGESIPTRAEEEQRWTMRWLLKIAAEEGPAWRERAAAELKIAIDRAKEIEAEKL